MSSKITQSLQKFGLSENEAKVYLSLLGSGLISVFKLAKNLEIARSTLYGILSSLQAKGIVSQVYKNQVKFFKPEPPEKIIKILELQEETIKRKKKELERLVPEIKKLENLDYTSPKIKLYEGKREMEQLFTDILLYQNIEVKWLLSVKDYIDMMGKDFIVDFNKKRLSRNISFRGVWPKSKMADLKSVNMRILEWGEKYKRQIRFLPSKYISSLTYALYQNKAFFISSKKENFGFLIESQEFVQMMKMQFEVLWRIAQGPKTVRT